MLRLFDCLQTEPNVLFQDSFSAGGQVLSQSERALLKQYRGLSPTGRETVRSVVEALCAYRDEVEQSRERQEPRVIPLYRCPAAAGYAAPVFGEDFDYIEVTDQVPAAAEFADQARYGWNDPQVSVDCLLGTGFNGAEVSGAGAEWIRKANASEAFRLACDVPSGLSARTGKVAEPCFKAHATVTMLAVKTGMTSEDAAVVVGELRVAPLMDE